MNWFAVYPACALAALLLGLAATWLARAAARRVGLWDKPQSEHHKNHTRPVPVAGGAAMWAAWTATVLGGIAAARILRHRLPPDLEDALGGIAAAHRPLLLVAGCATFLMLAGLRDDWKPMRAAAKFACQFLAAAASAAWGPRLLTGFLPAPLAWLLTVLWYATVINAFNFFDNMDGLAGGTGAIALFFLLVINAIRGHYFIALLHAAAFGAVLGFLAYNRPPASIFMGDSGSHFLGYLVASGCLLTTFYYPEASPTAAPVLIPVILLAVPLLDAVTVVCIRLRLHQPVYVGDNRHISHRFVHLGLSRPQAVLLVCLLSFITGVGALCLLWLPNVGAALVLLQTLAMMAVILIIQFRGHLPEKTEPK